MLYTSNAIVYQRMDTMIFNALGKAKSTKVYVTEQKLFAFDTTKCAVVIQLGGQAKQKRPQYARKGDFIDVITAIAYTQESFSFGNSSSASRLKCKQTS